ncbi:hypothetical protein FQA39_LY11862 [Lamprigera yunnana]|nr:hypothetical protein FQA39_LY11862 [Lamprigera yunnana]
MPIPLLPRHYNSTALINLKAIRVCNIDNPVEPKSMRHLRPGHAGLSYEGAAQRIAWKKFLTRNEFAGLSEDEEFLANLGKNEANGISVAIILPDPDELTDLEDIDNENLGENETGDDQDILGTLELCTPQNDDDGDDENKTTPSSKSITNL